LGFTASLRIGFAIRLYTYRCPYVGKICGSLTYIAIGDRLQPQACIAPKTFGNAVQVITAPYPILKKLVSLSAISLLTTQLLRVIDANLGIFPELAITELLTIYPHI
jgi:hypothetical protein